MHNEKYEKNDHKIYFETQKQFIGKLSGKWQRNFFLLRKLCQVSTADERR